MESLALRRERLKVMFSNLSLAETQRQNQENSVVRKDSVRNRPIQEESVQKKPVQRDSVLENIYIAVMGLTGVGKSTFISQLVGSKVAIGHELESCTCVPSPLIPLQVIRQAKR
jgi:putative ribosome biogenesis GTPase RsgA